MAARSYVLSAVGGWRLGSAAGKASHMIVGYTFFSRSSSVPLRRAEAVQFSSIVAANRLTALTTLGGRFGPDSSSRMFSIAVPATSSSRMAAVASVTKSGNVFSQISNSAGRDAAQTSVTSRHETIPAKIYRYADITGFFTRWFDRKAWVLDLEPHNRLATPHITEFERKLSIFMITNSIVLFFVSLYFWFSALEHCNIKPPCPTQPDYPFLDVRRNDFTWHSKIPGIYPRNRCKECRWLDMECKRRCFDLLKAEGKQFFVNGKDGPLTTPRFKLDPPHHTSSDHSHH